MCGNREFGGEPGSLLLYIILVEPIKPKTTSETQKLHLKNHCNVLQETANLLMLTFFRVRNTSQQLQKEKRKFFSLYNVVGSASDFTPRIKGATMFFS